MSRRGHERDATWPGAQKSEVLGEKIAKVALRREEFLSPREAQDEMNMEIFMKLIMSSAAMLSVLSVCMPAMAEQSSVSIMNELLQGELSAIETYGQALQKFTVDPTSSELKGFQAQHRKAATVLHDRIVKAGGTPVTGSGAWGTWAAMVTGTAKVFGETAALKVLKEGEEHGVKEYHELLENKNAPADLKEFVKNEVLPQHHDHIRSLDRLMAGKQAS